MAYKNQSDDIVLRLDKNIRELINEMKCAEENNDWITYEMLVIKLGTSVYLKATS